MTSVEDLKKYFESGDLPNSDQFKELITSMWHKSEKLPIEQIEGLVNQFANKFDKGSYNGNAQQLYDELKDSINEKYYNGLNTYPTKAIADGLEPFPADYTPMKISKDGANNGRYFSLNGVWVPDDNDLNNNIENINDYEATTLKAVTDLLEKPTLPINLNIKKTGDSLFKKNQSNSKLSYLTAQEYLKGNELNEILNTNNLNKGFYDSSGVFEAAENWLSSNPVDCKEGDVFLYTGLTIGRANAVVGYDANGNVTVLLGVTNELVYLKEIVIPNSIVSVVATGKNVLDSNDIFSFKKQKNNGISIAPSFIDSANNIAENLTIGVYKVDGSFDSSFTNWRCLKLSIIDYNKLYYTGIVPNNNVGVVPVIGFNELDQVTGVILHFSNSLYDKKILGLPDDVVSVAINYRYLNGDQQELLAYKLSNQKRLTINNELIYKINKSWGVIGHSIWYFDNRGDISTGDGTRLKGVQTLVQQEIEFTNVSKYAYSGNSLGGLSNGDGRSILSNSNSWVSHDIFTYDSITNDFKRNIPIGTQDDFLNNTGRTTYYGALRQLHDVLRGLNPRYRMICANSLKRNNDNYTSWSANTQGHALTDYSEALEWVANRMSWKFINQFRDSGINEYNLDEYTLDGLHPNNLGYAAYYKLWVESFKKI